MPGCGWWWHHRVLPTPERCAGCLLYFLLYGASPFERVLEQTGGSLALAVLNGSVDFPQGRSPQAQQLVAACLSVQPQQRPPAAQLVRQCEQVLAAAGAARLAD